MIMIGRHELEELERLAKAMREEAASPSRLRLWEMACVTQTILENIHKREVETAAFQELMDMEP